MRSALMLLLFLPLLLPTQEPPEKPLYQPTGKEATLLGSITVTGPMPKPMRIDMTADPICNQLNPKPEILPFVADAGGLLDAFVYVTGEAVKDHRYALPDSPVTLQRVKCQYSPHVLGMRVRQKLVIPNDDPTHHNTHPTPKLNREWNQTQPPHSEPLVKTFTQEEALIPFKCNQHPWEKAYVGVLDHPFFAVSNELGNYEIKGLPPGTYKIKALHPAFSEQGIEVTLTAGESRRVDFVFEVDDRVRKNWLRW